MNFIVKSSRTQECTSSTEHARMHRLKEQSVKNIRKSAAAATELGLQRHEKNKKGRVPPSCFSNDKGGKFTGTNEQLKLQETEESEETPSKLPSG